MTPPAASTDPAPSTRRGAADQRDAARRRRLLDTGLDVFGGEGYAASKIPEICRRAGVGTTSFYAEFATKEELLLGVYDEVIARVGVALGTALARPVAPGGLQEHVGAAVDAFITVATTDERAARVQLVEVVGVSATVEARRRGVLRAFAQVLADASARYAEAGLVARPVDRVTGLALVGAANELLVEWAVTRGSGRPSPAAIRAAMLTVVLGTFRGDLAR